MPLIVGTAGHIDHGKTALVRALTGQDTDRLPEERLRGISIALGFAHFDGPEGERAGVVDVPGHERFVRTMLAGAHGMDLVLFVVAADDGVMPQSEEHLDILHVLGVDRGIFVITKADMVSPERIQAVREEIEILAAGTTLERAPILAVSVVTGAGLAPLREAIARALATPRTRSSAGPFRLPVDRCFVMHGHGVVVTGTAIAGAVEEGDTLRALPRNKVVRVRSLQVHGTPATSAGAGQRVALNLVGVERGDVERGDVVCAPPLEHATNRFDAWVELRPSARLALERHARVRLHVGTSESRATVVPLDERSRLAAGEGTFAQIVTREPVVVLGGDRFVLRDETARWTLGGGVVLAPFADRHRAGDPEVLAALRGVQAGGAEAVVALLHLRSAFGASTEDLALALGTDVDGARGRLEAAGIVSVPDGGSVAWVLPERLARTKEMLLASVKAAHGRDASAPGVSLEEVRSRLPWDVAPRVFRWVVDDLVGQGSLERCDDVLRDPAHRIGLAAGDAALADRLVGELSAAGLMPPTVSVLSADLGEPEARLREVLGRLERMGRAVRVAPDLYYHPEAVETGKREVEAECRAHGEITAAAFRDRIGASRKFAIAFLDWCDRTSFTIRVGDARRLRR